jgi:hypothetical protein
LKRFIEHIDDVLKELNDDEQAMLEAYKNGGPYRLDFRDPAQMAFERFKAERVGLQDENKEPKKEQ